MYSALRRASQQMRCDSLLPFLPIRSSVALLAKPWILHDTCIFVTVWPRVQSRKRGSSPCSNLSVGLVTPLKIEVKYIADHSCGDGDESVPNMSWRSATNKRWMTGSLLSIGVAFVTTALSMFRFVDGKVDCTVRCRTLVVAVNLCYYAFLPYTLYRFFAIPLHSPFLLRSSYKRHFVTICRWLLLLLQLVEHVMTGIEDIIGHHGYHYWMQRYAAERYVLQHCNSCDEIHIRVFPCSRFNWIKTFWWLRNNVVCHITF